MHTVLPLYQRISPPLSTLFTLGNQEILKLPGIAIVGSRRTSLEGLRATYAFSRVLANAGLVIVSGLAKGIDGAAHQAALDCGGFTIAVVGHGLDHVYPAEHRSLRQQMVQSGRGLVISEYPEGTPPFASHFPARNRIIAVLSIATLVVSAGLKSGSLITARHSLSLGQDIYVVPGPFDDPHFFGSHELLRSGARLVCSPHQLLEELAHPLIRWVPPKYDKSFKKLHSFFEERGGVITQQQFNNAFQDGLSFLEQALDAGVIWEARPQTYLWVGS